MQSFISEMILIFLILTVVYGLIASPYLPNISINQLAEDGKANFPLGAEIFEEEIYVDDVLSGRHSLDEVNQMALETKGFPKSGCLPLIKWVSNDPAVLSKIPVEFRSADSKSFSDT